jgi:hypothetical protein
MFAHAGKRSGKLCLIDVFGAEVKRRLQVALNRGPDPKGYSCMLRGPGLPGFHVCN